MVKLWHYLLVFCVAFSCFINTLNHDFVLDDKAIITQNQFTQKGFEGITDHFAHSYWYGLNGKDQGNYRPLSGASFSIEQGLFGNTPLPFHLLNILFYSLLCVVLLKWLEQLGFFKPLWAVIAVLLFAAHPLHSEVVANIKSRDEIYAFIFVVLSFIAFTNSLRKQNKPLLILSGVLFLASLLSKETTLSLLPVFLILAIAEKNDRQTSIFSLSIPFAVTIIYLVIYLGVTDILLDQEYHLFDNSLTQEASGLSLFLSKIAILGRYLGLMLIPYPLRYDYSFNTIPLSDIGDPFLWLGIMVIIGALLLTYISLRGISAEKRTKILLFLGICTLPLIPVSNFLFLIGSTMAERFMFIPSFGVICILLLSFDVPSVNKLPKSVPMVIGGSLIILLGVLTLNRNKAWSSDEDLFANDLKVLSNNAKAHHNLANIYERHGNEAADEATKRTYYEGAISLIEKAETIHPVPEFYKQLGGLYGNVQRWDGSIKALNSYLELFPNEVAVLNQLGMAYGISGDLNSAQKVFKRSFELNPNDVQVCINLGKTYGMLGDYNNSLRILEKALILEPGNAEASRAYQTTQQIVGGL
ncbi:MAG: hypothetical protein HN542_06090 [Flavobacteriales bacterium]|jgi:protein O-mannosyl-transferase|nr:hypothetical protein [Flavobacteriales bacterium]MBT3964201.1 hypothetical protein [Flavobacteriales bacterium]MBT4703940.1 hypothetical protein [Flavobacteriales bacterium]MBT4930364.1 hypothetical protein [Flavobacteriales bacterium]MBT6133254.1 hypothetical protein [Flavobacteriales bacterium]